MSLHIGIPLMLLAALIQATILPHLRIFGGHPDLVIILTMAWAFLDDGLEGAAWALAGGVALDVLSGAPLGFSSLALLPAVFLISLAETQVYRTNAVLTLGIAGTGAVLYHGLYLTGLYALMRQPIVLMPTLYYVTLPSVAFDVILVLPAFWSLRPLYDKLHPRGIKL